MGQRIDVNQYELHLDAARAERGLDLAAPIRFDPNKHARDWRGRFRLMVGDLKPNQTVRLPDGTKVKKLGSRRDEDNYTYQVDKGGRGIRIHEGETAVVAEVSDDPVEWTPTSEITGWHGGDNPGERAGSEVYVALNKGVAEEYARDHGGRAHSVSYQPRNALVLDTPKKVQNAWDRSGALKVEGPFHPNTTGAFSTWAREQGHDAVVIPPSAFEGDDGWEISGGTWGEPQAIILRDIVDPTMPAPAQLSQDFDGDAYALYLAQARKKKQYIRKGDNGRSVKQLQNALSHLGHDIAVDGDFGPDTEKALREFQKRTGAQVDGIVGPETLGKIKNSKPANRGSLSIDAMEYVVDPDKREAARQDRAGRKSTRRSSGSSGSTSTKKGPHGGTVGASGFERATSTTGPIGGTDPSKDKNNPLGQGASNGDFESKHPRGGKGTSQGGKFVKKGDSGNQVSATQRQLNANGADLKVDGQFGPKTEVALKRFQTQAPGLESDGIVGPLTRAKFRQARRLRAKSK